MKRGFLMGYSRKETKATRRFLMRVAKRKGLPFDKVVSSFYGKKVEEINNSLLVALRSDKVMRSKD